MDSAAAAPAAQIVEVVEVVPARNPRATILRLPEEVGRMIYVFLFAMTRLSFGEVWFIPNLAASGAYALTPAENALALLRTCRQVSAEIGTGWLRHVLFHFKSAFAMLDKLAALPASLISEIRHVRIRTSPITVQWGGDRFDRWRRPIILEPEQDHMVTYNLTSTLKFPPHLQLHRLTVLTGVEWPDGGREAAQYHLLDLLIRNLSGWKELQFMCRNSFMLRWVHPFIDRHTQPMHWQSLLSTRDDTSSSSPPLVLVYRSKTPRTEPRLKPTALPHDPANWEPFEQAPSTSQMIVHGMGPVLSVHAEAMKKLLVIVKRGGDANYQEQPDTRLIDLDMREHAQGRRRREIRARTLDFDPVQAARQPTGSDMGYGHVDEYRWVFNYPQ